MHMISSEATQTTRELAGLDVVSLEKDQDQFLVSLDTGDDPQHLPIFRKWLAVLVVSSASLCVACSSSIVSFMAYVSGRAHLI